MQKKQKIWEENLSFAAMLDGIMEEKYKYSHEALCDLIESIIKYLRVTGYELEQYDRDVEIYLEKLLRLP